MDVSMVVVDWAGTVIDFGSQAPAGAFQKAFAECGVEATMAEIRGPMGLHKKDHIRAMLREPAFAAKWKAATRADWTEADVDALYQRVTPMQVAAAEEFSALVPGVIECVAALRAQGVKIAGTTGYFHAANDVVTAAGRRQGYVPDFNICADDVPTGRPKPWMIYRCMEALDVYPPKRVAKVGDTLIDVQDGLNAGVWSIAVVDSSSEMGLGLSEFAALTAAELAVRRKSVRARFQAAGADAVIDTLAELPAVLQTLRAK